MAYLLKIKQKSEYGTFDINFDGKVIQNFYGSYPENQQIGLSHKTWVTQLKYFYSWKYSKYFQYSLKESCKHVCSKQFILRNLPALSLKLHWKAEISEVTFPSMENKHAQGESRGNYRQEYFTSGLFFFLNRSAHADAPCKNEHILKLKMEQATITESMEMS